jgi:hypothetical protein
MVLIEKTQEVQAYDFIIFQEGNITKAFNTKTKSIEFQGTDTSTVIQNTINALPGGGKIFVKGDSYNLASAIKIFDKDNVVIDCVPGKTVFVVSPDLTEDIIQFKASPTRGPLRHCGINGLRIDMTNNNNDIFAISTERMQFSFFKNITILRPKFGMKLLRTEFSVFENIYISGKYTTPRVGIGLQLGEFQEEATGTRFFCDHNVFNMIYSAGFEIAVHIRDATGCVFNVLKIGGSNIGVLCGDPPTGYKEWVRSISIKGLSAESNTTGIKVAINTARSGMPVLIQPDFFGNTTNIDNPTGYQVIIDSTGIKLERFNRIIGGRLKDVSVDNNSQINFNNSQLHLARLWNTGTPGGLGSAHAGLIWFDPSVADIRYWDGTKLRGRRASFNSGVATILAGSTRVTVSHGLLSAPTKVLATPQANLKVWIENITATSFDIVVDVAPTVNVNVSWYAEI